MQHLVEGDRHVVLVELLRVSPHKRFDRRMFPHLLWKFNRQRKEIFDGRFRIFCRCQALLERPCGREIVQARHRTDLFKAASRTW
jgi:hypothetical protein